MREIIQCTSRFELAMLETCEVKSCRFAFDAVGCTVRFERGLEYGLADAGAEIEKDGVLREGCFCEEGGEERREEFSVGCFVRLGGCAFEVGGGVGDAAVVELVEEMRDGSG